MEEYFRVYLVCIEALLHMENYSEFQFAHIQNFIDLDLLRGASVHISRLFHFFPGYFCCKFDAIF